MRVLRSDLEKIFQMLMDSFFKNDMCHKEFVFNYDFYWTPPVGKRDDLYNKPELHIGSIIHDLERINHCILDNEPMLEHFRYLGNTLIAMADTIEHCIYQSESACGNVDKSMPKST